MELDDKDKTHAGWVLFKCFYLQKNFSVADEKVVLHQAVFHGATSCVSSRCESNGGLLRLLAWRSSREAADGNRPSIKAKAQIFISVSLWWTQQDIRVSRDVFVYFRVCECLNTVFCNQRL